MNDEQFQQLLAELREQTALLRQLVWQLNQQPPAVQPVYPPYTPWVTPISPCYPPSPVVSIGDHPYNPTATGSISSKPPPSDSILTYHQENESTAGSNRM